jgi:transcriptional regulator with XRE-family HTH domain
VNKNLTQAEAAKILGIRKETLANYEAGRTFPDVPTIKKMEELYGVQYSDINFFKD